MVKKHINKDDDTTVHYVKSGGTMVESFRETPDGVSGKGTVPIGSIVQSILTLAQFQTQAGTGWVLMDGASIVGSKLATITGWTNVPDASGRFLRTAGGSAAALSVSQGQATAVNNLSVSANGAVNLTHAHSLPGNIVAVNDLGSVGVNDLLAMVRVLSLQEQGSPGTGNSGTLNHSHTCSTTSIDTETRPVNLTVNTFIRIN